MKTPPWRNSLVKPRIWTLACLAVTLAGIAARAQSTDWQARGKLWWSHVQFLAGDDLEGRGTGTPGFEKAANYMAEQFRAAGLEPAGVNGYRQPMDFDVVRIDEARCALDLLRDGKAQPVKLGEDAVLGVNSHAAEKVAAGAVFVGYGLTVPELKYDDLGRRHDLTTESKERRGAVVSDCRRAVPAADGTQRSGAGCPARNAADHPIQS
jgi:hypothetical protein